MNFVLSSLSEGLLWSIMAIGVYLTFRILDIADMTAEGAFPLGAAVVVSQIQAGANPWLATLLALVAGLVSGMLHTNMKIPALLTGLYSINIKIMGSVPNLSLGDSATVFKQLASLGLTNEGAVFSLSLVCLLLVWS
ncbi:ABC transporter permease [Streptococcus pneumoniae]|nr:ABC transporter permease [Streptococcus pneumoniae]